MRIINTIRIGEALINANPDSAQVILLSALNESRSLHFNKGVAKSLITLALNAKKKLYYFAAEDFINEAHNLFLHGFKDSTLFIDLLNISGLIAHDQGQYAKAEGLYYRAIGLLEGKNACNDKLQLASSLQFLAEGKTKKNEPQVALRLLDRAEGLARACGDSLIIMKVYLNKSTIYYLKNDLEAALKYTDSVIDLSTKMGNLTMLTKAFNNKGLWLQMQGKQEQSITLFTKSIHLSDSLNNKQDKILALTNMGYSWLLLKKMDTAEQLLTHALEMAEQSGFKNGVSKAYDYLSELYTITSQHKKALNNLNKFNSYLQSYYDTEKQRLVAELDIRYHTAMKEKRIAENQLMIAQQTRRIDRQRNMIWIIISGAGLVVVCSTLLFLQQNRLKNNKILRLSQEKQIASLKNMMAGEEQERKRIAEELHDGIGGMLAALKMHLTTVQEAFNLTREDSAKSLMRMLDETAKEVRRTTHNLMPDSLYRYGFVKALEKYLDRIREGNKLEIQLQIPDIIFLDNRSFELALYRIFQELLQNIIRHAEARQVFIQIYQEKDLLSIMVEDDGIGYTIDKEHGGIGLNNIRNRVHSFDGIIDIQSAPGKGTLVHMEFNREHIQNRER